ncbi:Hypothetical predicted protein [Mytilus galloprovincialis]|uniref:Uncharacterized protein n=1 Tax=Mytilus galloprovincialis TaxID=29158 RepID=A0A8B6C2I4_MYTGA|nr:Hypothetical predicted protein [Mytilus galloprovincialis]
MSFQLNVDDFPPLIDPVDKMGIKNFLNNFKFSNKLANKNVGIKPVTVNTNNAETETIRQSKQSLRQKPKAKNKRPVSNIGTCGSSSKYVPKINLNYCLVPDSFTLSLHNSFDVLSISDKKENCHSVKISDTGEIPHGNKDKIPADYNNRLCNTSDKRTSLHIQAFDRAVSSKRNEQDVPIIKKKKVQCTLHSLDMCSQDLSILRQSPISLDKINSVFDTNITDNEEIFLCDSHFLKASRFESSHDKCKICCSSLKRKYKLMVDKMDKLCYYFQDKNLTPVDLSKNSDICKQCFSSITNFLDSDAFVEILSREKIIEILTKATNSSLPIYFDKSNTKSFEILVIKICNDLLQRKALLISQIVQFYKDFGGDFISDQLRNQNRILCNKLNLLFGDSIDCKYDPHGTVILMKGLNIVSCLIDSLAELKKFKTCTSHDENKLEENVQLNDGNVLKKAAEIIKLKIQSSCKIIKNSSNRNLSNFKFHDFIENTIDPILWNFLCSLIGQETQLQLPFGENSLSEDSVQFSQIFNICCCLIFNRDSKCNKFQMLIADIIDKFTNSSTDCFNLLNKFVYVFSKQTYERYQTQIVEEGNQNSINSFKCQFK